MSFFPNCNSPVFYNGSFTAADKVINNVNNYYVHPPGPGSKNRFRTILEGDLIFLREVSSNTFTLTQPPDASIAKLKTTNPFRVRLERNRMVTRVVRKVHTAEIVGFEPRKFTVVTFDSENGSETAEAPAGNALIWRRAYEISSSERLKRANHFPQFFALSESDIPSLIYHDELVGGDDIRYEYRNDAIIASYLHYLFQATYFITSSNDLVKKMSLKVSPYTTQWFFNLKSGCFLFDSTWMISCTESQSDKDETRSENDRTITRRSNSICTDIGPGLTPDRVVSHLQRTLSGYLHSLSSIGEAKRVDSLDSFARHGVLTFGSVIDINKDELLGHFPLTPRPQWYCTSNNSDATVHYSQSVKSRVEITFNPEVEGRDWELEIHFGFKLPYEASEQLRVAFLRQSPSFRSDCPDAETNLVLFEELRFVLRSTIRRSSSSKLPPVLPYLFIPPLKATWMNGMPCLRWPSSPNVPLFYWSPYVEGNVYFSHRRWYWHRGIPKTTLETWVGTNWRDENYEAVQDYLHLRSHHTEGQSFEWISQGDPLERWGQVETEVTAESLEGQEDEFEPREMSVRELKEFSLGAYRRTRVPRGTPT
ncbi:hypothetical protein V5O48_012128 [Marasmius crinis-equi]|uniref:Uncharacterized protein n=1 Tax=Marasmius crinis-equi TaxID=585013 RepID=A0ABR3F490_9AGAR